MTLFSEYLHGSTCTYISGRSCTGKGNLNKGFQANFFRDFFFKKTLVMPIILPEFCHGFL